MLKIVQEMGYDIKSHMSVATPDVVNAVSLRFAQERQQAKQQMEQKRKATREAERAKAEAEAKAQAYLDKHADSPHAKRVRSLMARAGREEGRDKVKPAPSARPKKRPAAAARAAGSKRTNRDDDR